MNVAEKDCGTIRDGFEMTGREYSICTVTLANKSPVRDSDYAVRAGCFLETYQKTHSHPGCDMVALIQGETRTAPGDWDKRRIAIEDMLRRSGYEPTPAEMEAYRAERKALRDDLLAYRKKCPRVGNDDDPPVKISRERRRRKAGTGA